VRVAVDAGVDGIVATAPFYARTHPAEIAIHFRAIAARAGVPLYAYDLPVSVHSKLGAQLLLDLAAEGVLAGLKDSSGDEGGLRQVVLGRRDRGIDSFAVLTGSELTVDSALWMGADGVVPGLGNVDPHGYVRLFQAAAKGDWGAARAEQERLFRLFDLVNVGGPHMGRGSSALGAFKAALHLRGIISHPTTALPQIPLGADEIAHVGAYLVDAALV
jgi:4-hydroxy-tetrahydrodipicolinate synthase